jgi:diguanylate cyclase
VRRAAGRPDDRSGWRSLVWPAGEVLVELRSRTLRRVRTVAIIAVPVHLAHLVVFLLTDVTSTEERRWRTGILVAHGALLAYAVVARWAATRAIRSPEGALARALPWVTGVVWVGAGAAIAAIDQLVTTSITPFLVGNLVAALVLILPPARAVWIYLAGLGGFAWSIALVQDDPSVVVSNQVNGVTAAALGLGVTVLQWRSEVRDVEKSQHIASQQAELEARNVELDRLASHDPLTGLVNRRQFEVLAEHELGAARREGWPLSLIQLDVDDFKQVNDRFGHPAGDALLRELAVLLEGRLRGSDVLARWGGEEFLVLLPRTDLPGAAAIAEDLRRAVADTTFVGPEEVAVTVSVGVAPIDAGRAAAIEAAYRDADRALYAAKAAGRDRVVLSAGPEEPVPPVR